MCFLWICIIIQNEIQIYLQYYRFSVLNILEKTPENRLLEIVIIDDVNDPPIIWNPDPSRVRIIRSGIRFQECDCLLYRGEIRVDQS